MRDPPLRLLKSSPVRRSCHKALTPVVELRHYKSAVYAPAGTQLFPLTAQTQVLCAVDRRTLSKTDRAYLDAQMACPISTDTVSNKENTHRDETTVPAEDGQFCVCGRPFLFGEVMIKCEGYCGTWYHPKCLGMYASEVRKLQGTKDRWYCDECLRQAYSIMLFCRVLGKK